MEQALRYTKYLDGQSQGQRNKKEQKLQASSLMKREKVTWRTREIREKLAESSDRMEMCRAVGRKLRNEEDRCGQIEKVTEQIPVGQKV